MGWGWGLSEEDKRALELSPDAIFVSLNKPRKKAKKAKKTTKQPLIISREDSLLLDEDLGLPSQPSTTAAVRSETTLEPEETDTVPPTIETTTSTSTTTSTTSIPTTTLSTTIRPNTSTTTKATTTSTTTEATTTTTTTISTTTSTPPPTTLRTTSRPTTRRTSRRTTRSTTTTTTTSTTSVPTTRKALKSVGNNVFKTLISTNSLQSMGTNNDPAVTPKPTASITTAATTTLRSAAMGAGQSATQTAEANHAKNLMVDRSSGGRYSLLDLHLPSMVGTVVVVIIILVIVSCILRFAYGCYMQQQSRAREQRIDVALGNLTRQDREMKIQSIMKNPPSSPNARLLIPQDDPLAV